MNEKHTKSQPPTVKHNGMRTIQDHANRVKCSSICSQGVLFWVKACQPILRRVVVLEWARIPTCVTNDGLIGLCKNAPAYRTVVLTESEGKKAMRTLKRFVGTSLLDLTGISLTVGAAHCLRPLSSVRDCSTEGVGSATRRTACASARLQSRLGAGGTQSRRSAAANGTHLAADDDAVQPCTAVSALQTYQPLCRDK